MQHGIKTFMAAGCVLLSVSAAQAQTSDRADYSSAFDVDRQTTRAGVFEHRTTRPSMLPVMYAAFGAVQAWDVYSTSAAVRNGAREANPLVGPAAGRPAYAAAIKAATTASTVFFVERLWRQNRVAAVVVMAAINGATAAVAMRNMQNARRVR